MCRRFDGRLQEITNSRRCSYTDRITLIPSAPAERGRVAQPGKNFIYDDHARKKAFAVHVHCTCQSQQCTETVAWVPSRIAVIEIEIAYHRRIDKGCGFGRQSITETQNTAGILARD